MRLNVSAIPLSPCVVCDFLTHFTDTATSVHGSLNLVSENKTGKRGKRGFPQGGKTQRRALKHFSILQERKEKCDDFITAGNIIGYNGIEKMNDIIYREA